jgi:hypothetical protein
VDGQFSFEAWIYRKNKDNDMAILSKGEGLNEEGGGFVPPGIGYLLFINGENNTVNLEIGDGDDSYYDFAVNGSTSLDVSKWYHIVAVIDKNDVGNCRIFVNGIDDTHSTYGEIGDVGSLINEKNLSIGSKYAILDYSSNDFNGTIDEIRIWNRSLSSDEIKELYESSATYPTQTNFSLSETNLGDSDVHYDFYRNGTVSAIWHFDEGEGNYTFDESGNNNTGNLQNSTDGVPQWSTDCKYGSCLRFDGIGDYIRVSRSSILEPSDITVETWIYLDVSPSSEGNIVSKGTWGSSEGYNLGIYNDGSIYFHIRNGTNQESITSDDLVPIQRWVHVAGAFDNSSKELAVNDKGTKKNKT